MKKHLFSIFLLLNSILLFSQNSHDKTIYFDSFWKESTKENCKFYRVIKDYNIEKDSYKIYDYYKSGVLQMEGTSKTKDGNSREGEYTFYYENGKKRMVENYVKSKVVGKFFEWRENGNKKLVGEYFESEKGLNSDLKMYEYWNSKNEHTIKKGNGVFEEDNDQATVTGKIKDGYKDGLWKGINKISKYQYSDLYKNGEFISGKSIDSTGTEREYKYLELRPLPKKGINDFYNYIGKNFTKTNEANQNKIAGKLIISFVIDQDGKIVEPKILKPLGYGLDEAIRVITSYENWIPGQQRGMNVRVLYSIPITVAL